MGIPDPFPLHSSTVLGAHPLSFFSPSSIRGKTLEREVVSLVEKGAIELAPSLSRLLQPIVCGDDGLRVVEARHRPFHIEPSRPQVSVQDGNSPVCASLDAERRLDGISGSQVRLLAGSNPSGQSQVSQVRSLRSGLPVQALCFGLSTAPQVFI